MNFYQIRSDNGKALQRGFMPHGTSLVSISSDYFLTFEPSTMDYTVVDCTEAPAYPSGIVNCKSGLSSDLRSTPACYNLTEHDCKYAAQCGWCGTFGKCVEGSTAGSCDGTCPLFQYTDHDIRENTTDVDDGPNVNIPNAGDVFIVSLSDDSLLHYNNTDGRVSIIRTTIGASTEMFKVFESSVAFKGYSVAPLVNNSVVFIDFASGTWHIWQCQDLHTFTFIGSSSGCSVVKSGIDESLTAGTHAVSEVGGSKLVLQNPSTGLVRFYEIAPISNSTGPLVSHIVVEQNLPGSHNGRIISVGDDYYLDFNHVTNGYRLYMFSKELGLTGPVADGTINVAQDGSSAIPDAAATVIFGGEDRLMLITADKYYLIRMDFEFVWNSEVIGLLTIGKFDRSLTD